MSGHSKWSTIKHKKAKVDSQRAVVFQKYSRELIVSARLGGPDPAGNFRLRTAIEKAKAAGLPNDNIKRAIEKGAGASGAENYEELTYEGYAAGGVAVVIEAMTDNRNRTAGDIRSYFTKYNGSLGATGCVGWMFDQRGVITFDEDVDFDKLFEAAINLDALDVIEEEGQYKVLTTVENFQSVVEGLEKEGFKSETAELSRIPQNTVAVTDEKTAEQILKLLDKIEEHDDVQNVYANFDISDELIQKLEG
ncbi:TPA: YebC/PmpR family DNA-binding transcriptional regulator [Candidatus Scatousia excrementigallinarum]|uniref:Probable transcriptional regulatory protein IAC10_11885 n=1 Tax=Candidatus Scatousia excrementigallinarum TaxID=2840935 RepID=A0A9D1F0I4_9BACT|nr:YebC/PmpR family DNA-binding transcriptional regulator [Candidatus Scatousia excrementigallinarum]